MEGKSKDQVIDDLKTICAEAYQVVGALASECGRFDDPKVIKALDNLSQQELVHSDVLPFPSSNHDLVDLLTVAEDWLKELVQHMAADSENSQSLDDLLSDIRTALAAAEQS